MVSFPAARASADEPKAPGAGALDPLESFRVPPLSERMAIREAWLEKRHALLLDMMRRHGVGMWIVVNEEFHDDPLTQLVAPPRPYVGNRDLFVFVDAGERGLRRVAITGYSEEQLTRFFEAPEDPKPAKEVLPALVAEHDPKTIALATGGRRGVTRSLTADSEAWLREILGPDASKRIVPAADLIEEYLDTRLPEERPVYERMVAATEALVARAFSREVITPGATTIGEVRRWLYDRADALGYDLWFQPDLRLQRRGMPNDTSRGFLAVAREEWVIQPGDLLHVDFGLVAMGLMTDWQKMAYVLRDGESDAPEGLRAALARTNALQDALCRSARPGREAGEVYTEVMGAMDARGIVAQVYSHPLGNQGHGLGASIDFRAAKRDDAAQRAAKTLRAGSYLAVELNTRSPVPEWEGQEVYVMQEDPAWLAEDGYRFFRPRQERFYRLP
ncbi:MAG: aminopeptidase P family protein [Acidobacteria bacterium]|nr:aminopeptidase P family protein [Acidobacteriota bacterium]MCB9377353.1 aminopeptidase P family protein [Holophagales bacterium]